MAANPPPPPPGGMSLYANLLGSQAASSASISSAPVLYAQPGTGPEEAAAKKIPNAALRFQPIRRPQVKPAFKPKATHTSTSAAQPIQPPPIASSASNAAPPPAARATLADWTATKDYEHNDPVAADKRQRGGRKNKNKKKNHGDRGRQAETDWDEIYDPARPTNVDEYLRSEERIREVQEWKRVLYAHRMKGRRARSGSGSSRGSDSDSDASRRHERSRGNPNFAPPNMSFAPPPPSPRPAAADDDDEDYVPHLTPSPPRPTSLPHQTPPPPPPPPPADLDTPRPPPEQPSASISRLPVVYSQPTAPQQPPPDDPSSDTAMPDAPNPESITRPTSPQRPNKATFAKRLMSKYGWTAGTGLGASSEGIITPLSVKIEKRRRRPDAEGGGFLDPAGGRGKVIGGKLSSASKATAGSGAGAGGGGDYEHGGGSGAGDGFGKMSTVIELQNMLTGIPSLREEISDGGLGQEIGEECGDKYGRVERLYFDYDDDAGVVPDHAADQVAGINATAKVFIKFTDGISALRAVNALHGRVFNGNAIVARFFEEDRFERGEYR